MKRFGRLVILAMLTAAFMVPGLTGTASAMDAESAANLCWEANGSDQGTTIGKYTVAYQTGGSGSQIILGNGTGYFFGGSGDDVLCAWGGNNILEGGSGNDMLVVLDGTGNEFYGGSGNDLMVGYAEDYFDGGSGNNIQEFLAPVPLQEVWVADSGDGLYAIGGSGFTPGASGTIGIYIYSNNDFMGGLTGVFTADDDGIFFAENDVTDLGYDFLLCPDSTITRMEIWAFEADMGVQYSQEIELDCS